MKLIILLLKYFIDDAFLYYKSIIGEE